MEFGDDEFKQEVESGRGENITSFLLLREGNISPALHLLGILQTLLRSLVENCSQKLVVLSLLSDFAHV